MRELYFVNHSILVLSFTKPDLLVPHKKRDELVVFLYMITDILKTNEQHY
jgi:hypothetical protein